MLGELARGGMGVVYRARDPRTGRELALKTLLHGKRSERHRARFLREGQLTAALDHPGILRVHACGEEQGVPWLAYELVEGCRELDQAWKELPRARRVDLVLQVARALGHAHAAGVVHRDVKPGNVLVDRHGRARVADFGLAAGVELEHLTRTGEVVGTPTHMAPEQLRGEGTRDATVDVWATGILLYEALTGTQPYAFTSLLDLTHKLHTAPIEAPRRRDPSVPRDLEAVCLRALQRDPALRYPHAAALADDLHHALRGEPTRAGSGRRRALLAAGLSGLVVAGAAFSSLPPSAATAQAPADSPRPSAAGFPPPGQAAASPQPEPSVDPTDPAGKPPRAFPDPDHFVISSLLEGAAQGRPGSMSELGEVWRAGLYDVAPDVQAAIYWFRRSEAAGNPLAATRVTKTLLDAGDDEAFLPLNRLQQASHTSQVADAAHQQYHAYLRTRQLADSTWIAAGRQAGCGTCHHLAAQALEGAERLEALEQAGAAGSVPATLELAQALSLGSYGRVDPDAAATLYERLVDRGVPQGMVRLAELHLSRRLRQSDLELARHWLEVATRGGDREARQLLHEHFPD